MELMYSSPDFKITLNDKDISHLVISIVYEDFESNNSDTLKIKLFPQITPKLKDKLQFYINSNLMGSFSIASIAYTYKSSYEIDCSSIDFNSNFKMRKNRSFDNLSYKQILESIAKENNFTLKIDFDRMNEIVHIDQINESDSSVCHKIATELNLTQCVKNDTLIFLQKHSEKKPTIYLKASDCVNVSLESYAKLFYKSVVVSYQDKDTSKAKTIRIGKEEPTLKRFLHSKSDDEAYKKAEGIFKSIQSNKKKGSLELPGRVIYAGTILRLSGDKELEGEYIINKVSHNIDCNGWKVSVVFG